MNGLKRLRALGSRLEQMAAVRATVRVDGKPLWRVLLDIAGQIEREQAEAVAWVREHGGLEPIKSSLSALELLAEGIEIDTGLAFYDESPKERCVALRNEVKSRLMPEGMEWPRTDDGKPVKIGDELIDDEDVHGWRLVDSIIFTNDGDGYLVVLENVRGATDSYSPGERVKRPAPKVLDADGVEIREKCDVWWICEGDERGVHAERLRVETIGPNGLIECSPYNGGTWVKLEPSELYVNKPVLAADGKPLREGETVYKVGGDGTAYVFDGMSDNVDGLAMLHHDGEPYIGTGLRVDQLTHRAPVLATDGRPLREGETIYLTDSPTAFVVDDIMTREDGATVVHLEGGAWNLPQFLTHEQPDSWERLEEDAKKSTCEYFDQSHGCGSCGHYPSECSTDKDKDLVRRAKKLAGVIG